MSFPSPSLAAPALVSYEMQFRGVTFGGFSDASFAQFVRVLKGTDGATVVGGDTQRAIDQGELIGVDLLAGKDIELELLIRATEAVTADEARQKIGGVLGGVGGVTEEPFYLELPGGVYASMARPRKHSCPIDLNMVQAGGGNAISLLHSTDPRWYAMPTKTASVGLPGGGGGGITFPLTFPLDFGGTGGSGELTVYNNGTIEMRPILIVKGPCVNPSISNVSIVGSPVLMFDITLEEGDVLEIDTDFETVLYTPKGAPVAVDRRNSLDYGSTWWNLPPGANLITWKATEGSGEASLTVQSADAFAAL